MTRLRTGLVGALLPMGLLLTGTAVVAPATAGTIVEVTPADTPHVLDGVVRAITRVGTPAGDRIVLGGSFTKVKEHEAESDVERVNLVSFDPETGEIDAGFVPNPDGTVHVVEPGPQPGTVYVGGEFSDIGGVSQPRLALVSLVDGSVNPTFDPRKVAGKVKDLALRDGRLWVAGGFTHIAGRAQPGLATVHPTTGALDGFMSLRVAGKHRGGFTTVANVDLNTAGNRMFASGNFRRVDGKRREQLVLLGTGGRRAKVLPFRTQFFQYQCRRVYNSYVDDVKFSPGGSFFVVTTTGGRRENLSPCDATMRFETGARGRNVRYSWLDKTGGDSNDSLAVTESVVYVGGHARWQNNTYGDNHPGPGAVRRPSIAALNPDNGLPLSWQPTKQRGGGQGIGRLYVDQLGLWIGSDTEKFNYQVRPRVVLLPDQGREVPQFEAPSQLPKLYLGGVPEPEGSSLVSRTVGGGGFGPDVDEPAGPIEWRSLKGAFLLDGWLYTATRSGELVRRSFDGSGYGPEEAVDAADQVVPLGSWRNDITKMTSMFFDRGRIYFTRAGSSKLFYRYFSPESGVVGVDRRPASKGIRGVDFSRVSGMTLAGGKLHWTTPAGVLKRVKWATGTRSGRPVPGTVRVLSGPKKDGSSWKARVILAPDPS
jgi:hypothetical protein